VNLTVRVDAPLFAPDAAIRPWRTTALLASGLAALELVALVVAGVALLGGPLRHHVEQQAVRSHLTPRVVPKAPKAVPDGKPKLARAETSVLVLNGNGRQGAATDEAARVRARGYIVGGVGNAAKQGSGASVVMYRPGYRPEALRLARDLRVRAVGPLDGMRTSDLLGAHLALIIGS
jgi:LytR cell envelope-related transcriptional attenuator